MRNRFVGPLYGKSEKIALAGNREHANHRGGRGEEREEGGGEEEYAFRAGQRNYF